MRTYANIDRVLVALCGALVGLTFSVLAGEPPSDTGLAKYVITYVDTSQYHQITYPDGHKTIMLACKGGDIIVSAEVWPEDLAKYREIQRQTALNQQETEEAMELVKQLDSLLSAKVKK